MTDEPNTEAREDDEPQAVEDLDVNAEDAEGIAGGDNFPDVPDNHLKL
jgi:hypothetical protein